MKKLVFSALVFLLLSAGVFAQTTSICYNCNGTGRVVLANPCTRCKGAGTYVLYGTKYSCTVCNGTGIATMVCPVCFGTGSRGTAAYPGPAPVITPSSPGSSPSSGGSNTNITGMVRNYQNMARNVEQALDNYRNAVRRGATQSELNNYRNDVTRLQQRMRQYRLECNSRGASINADYYETVRP